MNKLVRNDPKHGVTIITRLKVRCHECDLEWIPSTGDNGRLKPDYRRCPNGCNASVKAGKR